MAEGSGTLGRTNQSFIVEPSARRSDAVRYGLALAIVVVVAIGSAYAFSQIAPEQDTSEVDSAVLVELPPIAASAQPLSDAAEGAAQQATPASGAQQAPEQIERPRERYRPDEPQTQSSPITLVAPPQTLPDPSVVLERKQR